MWEGRLFDPDRELDPFTNRVQIGLLFLLALPTAYAGASAGFAGIGAALQVLGIGTGSFDSLVAVGAVGLVAITLIGGLSYVLAGLVLPVIRGLLFAWSETLFLAVLPGWGLLVNASLPACNKPCLETYEALAWPGVFLVYGGYLAGLLAYLVFRVRRQPLPLRSEAPLLGLLGLGTVTCVALTLQFAPKMPAGLVFAPIGLPLLAPPICALALLGMGLWRILRLGGGRRLTSVSAAVLAFFLGLWLLASYLLTGVTGLFGGAMTQTCGWTLSELEPPPGDCHYLCTVAAQGHPWLVRPLRLGRRRGRTIVVNRQLAVANAFEDLLHERWPRLGRVARRSYDRVGLPISRYLLHPLAADVVYMAMLPAQWGFYLVLLFLDPGDPEERLDRMYR